MGRPAGRGGRRRGRRRTPASPRRACPARAAALERVAQLDQQLDVERGVAQPGLGERAGGPVGGGVLLGQGVAEHLLEQRGQPDAREAEEAAGELGVEQPGGREADLAQAGQVLGRRVQDPLGALERFGERSEVGNGDRVDQVRAASGTPQLHEVGALAVAVARRALGVDGDGTGAGGDRVGGGLELLRGDDDVRHAVAGGHERDHRALGGVVGGRPGGSRQGALGVAHGLEDRDCPARSGPRRSARRAPDATTPPRGAASRTGRKGRTVSGRGRSASRARPSRRGRRCRPCGRSGRGGS